MDTSKNNFRRNGMNSIDPDFSDSPLELSSSKSCDSCKFDSCGYLCCDETKPNACIPIKSECETTYRCCCDQNGCCALFPADQRSAFWPEFSHPRWLPCKELYTESTAVTCPAGAQQ